MNQPWSIDTIQRAWELASRLHRGQTYGGPAAGEQIEYLDHIGSVAFEVLQALAQGPGLNAELALTCAILHDVLEDTPCTYANVAAAFGEPVARGVLALTKDAGIADRREQMRDSLRRIRQQPREVWAVKLADRIANLAHPPYYWDDAKKRAYQQESELILSELQAGNAYLAQRLRAKIEGYSRFLASAPAPPAAES
ncbi:HD domain-containing protein [Hymenobacter sp. B81]|uniref:HD domain-containing protein n=1 Tax=Hymenobacter sp. B81 TaxID=3344878 RepID=UPI0037DDD491